LPGAAMPIPANLFILAENNDDKAVEFAGRRRAFARHAAGPGLSLAIGRGRRVRSPFVLKAACEHTRNGNG
jgi:hypothetical protein